jgi:hypothetical protein
MSVLLSPRAVDARRAVASGPLRSLAASLAADLEPLVAREIYFPADKALLSRTGGRCETDGTMLEFDPFSPHEHRCPRCGRMHTGELHNRFWIYWYQLWLAERAVHAASLSALGFGERYASLAHDILSGYADRYLRYPNVDNVLGPTRLFFSTYLESIWLLQICIAADLIRSSQPALVDRVCEEIVEPSRDIIGQFDEGGSNRQVWNDVALLAAARLVGDRASAQQAILGGSGLAWQIANGLLSDGTWYEGENYHLFAHRGLWYGVTMAEEAGIPIDPVLIQRFQRGFAAPFLSALPDFTLPSRRDSQYAISLRQWRIAEHCELGLARGDDETLRGALQRMYSDDVPRGAPRRDRSAADVERNMSASSLSRADLNWRALLFALPELPLLRATSPASALLAGQGLAVFRREEGRTYVALDYGHAGGGHGHPDRLNLLLARDDVRWLDDFGTGSYVERTLHWYRSTLAHNAPFVDGHSQQPTDGRLTAYDERSDSGWISAEADIAPTFRAQRSVVVMPDYLVDTVEWQSVPGTRSSSAPGTRIEPTATFDLPLHAAIELGEGAGPAERGSLSGGHGLEDGFDFARDTTRQQVGADARVTGHASGDDQRVSVWATSSADCEWWRAVAPGAPGHGDHAFRLVRARANAGRHRFVWAWSDRVADVAFGDSLRVTLADGVVHHHRPGSDRWEIEIVADTGTSNVVLAGAVARPFADGAPHRPDTRPSPMRLVRGRELAVSLGAAHYRRSEDSWEQANRPTADVAMRATGQTLRITVTVPRSDVTFAPRNAENPYDNELADVNGDGLQLHAKVAGTLVGWMLVPELGGGHVRVRTIGTGTEASAVPSATWQRIDAGYRVVIEIDVRGLSDLDLIVNEMPRGRHRRRGQLVLSGGRGEFVYLRGDRHDENRLIPLEIVDG